MIRPYSHSLSDDEKLYRPDAERAADAQRDPITRMQMFLMREGILDEEGINQLEKEVDDEVQEAADRALERRCLRRRQITQFVYSPDLDPTSARSQTEPPQFAKQPSDGKKRVPTRPWPISSTRLPARRDEARSSASSSLAKTSPTAAAKNI